MTMEMLSNLFVFNPLLGKDGHKVWNHLFVKQVCDRNVSMLAAGEGKEKRKKLANIWHLLKIFISLCSYTFVLKAAMKS